MASRRDYQNMINIEEMHCSVCINAVLQANLQLMLRPVAEAVQQIKYGKTDTLGLDGIPESAIKHSLESFDKLTLLITEEIGATNIGGLRKRNNQPTVYLSDPTDRSSQLLDFFLNQDQTCKVGEIIMRDDTICEWEQRYSGPASITGATSAITCVRYGVPFATAFVNFVTQELFIAFRRGAFRLKLPSYTELDPAEITLKRIMTEESTYISERLHKTPRT